MRCTRRRYASRSTAAICARRMCRRSNSYRNSAKSLRPLTSDHPNPPEAAMTLAQLHRWNVAALILLVLLAPWRAAAQELYGSVVGTVQDGSGARIPGATIEIV